MKTQKFGIEIEMTGITRKRAAEVITQYFETTFVYAGGTYDAYEIRDKKGRIWKCMSDASIACQKKTAGGKVFANKQYSVEVVSPILVYEDIEDLQEIVRQLRHTGAFVNQSCGIHIHIDAKPHTPETLKNLVNLMAQKEDILYKALKVSFERLRYCQKVNERLIDVINRKKPKTLEALADMWYGGTISSRRHHMTKNLSGDSAWRHGRSA